MSTSPLVIEAAKKGYDDVLNDITNKPPPQLKTMPIATQRWALNYLTWHARFENIGPELITEIIEASKVGKNFIKYVPFEALICSPDKEKWLSYLDEGHKQFLVDILQDRELIEFLTVAKLWGQVIILAKGNLASGLIMYGNINYIKRIISMLEPRELEFAALAVGALGNATTVAYMLEKYIGNRGVLSFMLSGAIRENRKDIIDTVHTILSVLCDNTIYSNIISYSKGSAANTMVDAGIKHMLSRHGDLCKILPLHTLIEAGYKLSPETKELLLIPEIINVVKPKQYLYTMYNMDQVVIHAATGLSYVKPHKPVDIPKSISLIKNYGITSREFMSFILDHITVRTLLNYMTMMLNTRDESIIRTLYAACARLSFDYYEGGEGDTVNQSLLFIGDGNIWTTSLLAREMSAHHLLNEIQDASSSLWVGPNTIRALSALRKTIPAVVKSCTLRDATTAGTRLKRWMRSHMLWEAITQPAVGMSPAVRMTLV